MICTSSIMMVFTNAKMVYALRIMIMIEDGVYKTLMVDEAKKIFLYIYDEYVHGESFKF